MPELFVGLMSGTSMDAVDAVLVDLSGTPPRLVTALSHPFPEDLRQPVRRLAAQQSPHPLQCLGELDHLVGELFSEAVLALLGKAKLLPTTVQAIGSHGQTLFHQPNGPTPFTLQIGDPNIIAERTGIVTVADFRRRDMAAGGQGAPLVPVFHAAMFHTNTESRAVLNIGGIANLTLLPARGVATGFDTGPGNTLLDAWARRHLDRALDEGGRWAVSGQTDEVLLDRLLADAYFSQPSPKSTGPEYFNLDWLEKHLRGEARRPADVQATLVELSARGIADALTAAAPDTSRLLVCGGGVRNDHLMARLRHHLPDITLEPTDAYGIDPDWMEAMAFAWVAKQTLGGEPGNLPSVTGARHPVVLGGIYAGGTTTQ